ncbi:MAG: YceI family protein [Fimbriimonas sp.]
MKTGRIASALFLVASLAVANAQTVSFKVGGSRAQQLATVESVTDFETFTGRTDKVTGSIQFDPKAKKGSGRIVIDVASIGTGIDLRDDHMRSPGWLDAAKHPEITFEVKNSKNKGGDKYEVTGLLTLKGITKEIKTQVVVKHLKESDVTRKAGFKGDVLQVRGTFPIKLADHGIVISGPAQGKVGEVVNATISVYAQSGS